MAPQKIEQNSKKEKSELIKIAQSNSLILIFVEKIYYLNVLKHIMPLIVLHVCVFC